MFNKLLLLFSIFFVSFFFQAKVVYAACNCNCNEGHTPGIVSSIGQCMAECSIYPTSAPTCPDVPGSTTAAGGTASAGLKDPLGGNFTPQSMIGKVISAALGVVGSLALLMFIYGGFTWMTSAGSPDKVTKGKGIMVWAAIGLAVIFSSYALVKFVIDSLVK